MRRKILIVDDEQEIRQFLNLVLRDRGHEVLTAAGAREGLTLARSEKPDLVLLDIMMPEVDGWTVLRQLKEDGETAGIPVAILSARSEASDRAQALMEGAIDYITKPFSLHDLLGRVDRLLGPGEKDGRALARGEA